jgi:hypothetical protein
VTQKTRTVLDVLTGLFKPLFPPQTWKPWVLAAAAVFGLTYGLTPDDQAFILRCLGRTKLPTDRAQRAVFVIGRRGGKSRFASFLAVFLACFYDWSPVLSVGERGTGMVIAPDRRQARTCFRYIASFIDHVPMLRAMVESRTREAIHLKNGISIEVHTASFRAVRGYTVIFAILDEVAFLPTDQSAEPDSEIITALVPALATTNGLLIMISSPYAKRGELFRAVKDHFGKDDDPVLVWKADTRTMNPTITESLVAQAYEEDPLRAASEWGAEFRADIESFATREAIEACVRSGPLVLPRIPGVSYTAFLDFSGGGAPGGDSTTACVVHRDKDGRVIVDWTYEKRPPFNTEAVCIEIADGLKRYGISQARADRYAGEFPAQQLAKRQITLRRADLPKSDIYREFLAILNSGRVELPNEARLVGQLVTLERRTARGGKDSIDHPPGGHDDVANAVAGAVVTAAGHQQRPVQVVRLAEFRSNVAAAPAVDLTGLPAELQTDPAWLSYIRQYGPDAARARYRDMRTGVYVEDRPRDAMSKRTMDGGE